MNAGKLGKIVKDWCASSASQEILNQIDADTWTTGGCVALAYGLMELLPGSEVIGLIQIFPDGSEEIGHVGVLYNGRIIDADGLHASEIRWLTHWNSVDENEEYDRAVLVDSVDPEKLPLPNDQNWSAEVAEALRPMLSTATGAEDDTDDADYFDDLPGVDNKTAKRLAAIAVDVVRHYREDAKSAQAKDPARIIRYVEENQTADIGAGESELSELVVSFLRETDRFGRGSIKVLEAVLLNMSKPVFFDDWQDGDDPAGGIGFCPLEYTRDSGDIDLATVKNTKGDFPVMDMLDLGLTRDTVEAAMDLAREALAKLGCSVSLRLGLDELWLSSDLSRCGYGLKVSLKDVQKVFSDRPFTEYYKVATTEPGSIETAIKTALKACGAKRLLPAKDALEPQNQHNVTIEGVACTLRYYDDMRDREKFKAFKHAMKIFHDRLAKLAPRVLGHMTHVNVSFTEEYKFSRYGKDYKAGAIFNRREDLITVFLKAMNPNDIAVNCAKIIAHELGHRVFMVELSDLQRLAWTETIKANFKPIDIEAVLKRWPKSEPTFSFMGRIIDEDPVMFLKLECALQSGPDNQAHFKTREDLVERVKTGKKMLVPDAPVTPYGMLDPEEAFCEVLGLLVGYGPKTVLPWVKHVFSVALALDDERLTLGKTVLPALYLIVEALANRVASVEVTAVDWSEPPKHQHEKPKQKIVAPAHNPYRAAFHEAADVAGVPGWADNKAVLELVHKESSFNPEAKGTGSSAFGLFQLLKGTWDSLMPEAEHGTKDPALQALAGFRYIKKRYGTPERALAFWNATMARNPKLAPKDIQHRASQWIKRGHIGY